MNLGEFPVANVGVNGGRVETGVAEDALDRPQAGAAVHEVGGAGMAQQVTGARLLEADPIEVFPDHVTEASG